MAMYLAMRIMKGKLDYKSVTGLYPQLKTDIDEILINEGREELIVSAS